MLTWRAAHFSVLPLSSLSSQDSATACAAWSESDVSEDECMWNAEDEMCEMVMDDGDTDGSGSGSGSEEMDDCANYNNNRGECEMYGCDFAATMMTTTTTMSPTMSPTMPPTMPPVRPPTISAGTCPRNCGTAARGGGTCRANVRPIPMLVQFRILTSLWGRS